MRWLVALLCVCGTDATESTPEPHKCVHGTDTPHPNRKQHERQLNFKVPAQCQTVCRVVLGEKEKKQFIKAIDQDYRVHWYMITHIHI